MELINTIKTKLLITTFLFAPYFPVVAQEKLSDDDIIDRIPADMVVVQGGTFAMGATDGCGYDDERPIHNVTLTSFKISKYEVTQQLWNLIMDENPSTFQGDSLPVNNISWDECQTFIKKLNKKTGKIFRLPTEAEWEFAARGGINSKNFLYSGDSESNNVSWTQENSKSETHNVKTKAPNELGLYDMSGNVWEWCQDRYGSYSSSSQTNPTGPSSGSYRVNRGGNWFGNASYCRVSRRNFISQSPGFGNFNLGLRLAL